MNKIGTGRKSNPKIPVGLQDMSSTVTLIIIAGEKGWENAARKKLS